MKRHVQEPGIRKWSGDDLLELQSEGLSVADRFFSQYGNCVITGCVIAGNSISAGLVTIGGIVMPFDGLEAEIFPVYLVRCEDHIEREYADDVVRDIVISYSAKAVYLKPANDYITISADGTMLFFDNIKPGWLDDSLNDLKKQLDVLLQSDADTSKVVKQLLLIAEELGKFNEKTSTRLAKLETLLNYIPTLENEPSRATLTYKIGEIVCSFQIGQQCRVYDMVINKYVFYQLFNITDDKNAVWKKTIDEVDSVMVVDSLPVNTVLQALPLALQPFGAKWLSADGSIVYQEDYPELALESYWQQWTTIPSASYQPYSKPAYGKGIFVGHAAYGDAIWSEDGETWHLGSRIDSSSGYYSMAYGNGVFVMANDHVNGNISYWSTDGKNWTQGSGLHSDNYSLIVYGNGVFVCVCDRSFYWSTDGKIWTLGSGYFPYSTLIWDGLRFIAMDNNRIYTSTDGKVVTSQQKSISFQPNDQSMIYVNNIYYCLSGTVVYTSPDGVNWTNLGTVPIVGTHLTFHEGLFVCGSTGNQRYLAFSSDRTNWQKIAVPGSSSNLVGFIFKKNKTVLWLGISKIQKFEIRRIITLPVIENHFIKALK